MLASGICWLMFRFGPVDHRAYAVWIGTYCTSAATLLCMTSRATYSSPTRIAVWWVWALHYIDGLLFEGTHEEYLYDSNRSKGCKLPKVNSVPAIAMSSLGILPVHSSLEDQPRRARSTSSICRYIQPFETMRSSPVQVPTHLTDAGDNIKGHGCL